MAILLLKSEGNSIGINLSSITAVEIKNKIVTLIKGSIDVYSFESGVPISDEQAFAVERFLLYIDRSYGSQSIMTLDPSTMKILLKTSPTIQDWPFELEKVR
jgi:hypothetical protein